MTGDWKMEEGWIEEKGGSDEMRRNERERIGGKMQTERQAEEVR